MEFFIWPHCKPVVEKFFFEEVNLAKSGTSRLSLDRAKFRSPNAVACSKPEFHSAVSALQMSELSHDVDICVDTTHFRQRCCIHLVASHTLFGICGHIPFSRHGQFVTGLLGTKMRNGTKYEL